MTYIIAFSSTILLEFLVISLLIRKKIKLLFLASIAINSITWPIVEIIYGYLWNELLIIELMVFLAESILGVIILKIKLTKSLIIYFLANLVSTFFGFIIFK